MEIAPRGTAERRQQDLEMMGNPDRWPMWPKLPLKRSGYEITMGFLFNGSFIANIETKPTVYLHAIFETIDAEHVLFIEYTDLEAVVDDGWTVD